MRISMASIDVLASHWLSFLARGVVALLLAFAIVTSTTLHLDGFVGALGLYAVTDGVVAGISWLRDRRLADFAAEGAASIVAGFAMFIWSHTAVQLLLMSALWWMCLGGVQAWHARRTLSRRDALPQTIGAGLLAASGFGYAIAAAFGYGALDLHACIAGSLALFGAILVRYAIKLHAAQRVLPPHGDDRRSAHEARPAR